MSSKEVGEEDIVDEEFAEGDPFDDGYGLAEGVDDGYDLAQDEYKKDAEEEEEEVPPLDEKPARRFEIPSKAGLLPVKQQVATPARMAHPSGEKVTKPMLDPENRAPLTSWELFKESKRSEATSRDLGAKAICKIKQGIRQPESQKDGKPFIPGDWEKRFKPVLGSFKKFILMRSDQFRIVPCGTPDLWTLEIISNETVVAPTLEKGKKGKAKGKGKVKGTSWDDLVSGGKDLGKSWGKGKKGKDKGKSDFKGKGKVKGNEKEKGKGKTSFIQAGASAWTGNVTKQSAPEAEEEPQPPAARPPPKAAVGPAKPPTRAAQLIAEAAREALAEEEEEALDQEAVEEGEAAEEDVDEEEREEIEANGEEDAAEEEDGGAFDEDRKEHISKESGSAEEEEASAEAGTVEPDILEGPKHGSFITTLLSGSLLGGLGKKRPAPWAAAGDAKRRT